MAVEFDEDKGYNPTYNSGQKESKMATWLISKKFAKTEKSANAILVTIAVIFFAIAIYVAFFR